MSQNMHKWLEIECLKNNYGSNKNENSKFEAMYLTSFAKETRQVHCSSDESWTQLGQFASLSNGFLYHITLSNSKKNTSETDQSGVFDDKR